MKRWNTETVAKFIEENQEGYSLIGEYLNSKEKISIRCDKEHTYSTTFNVFKRGFRCPFCSGKAKLTEEKIKEFLTTKDVKWFGGEYKNNKSKLTLQCKDGHIYDMRVNNFLSGQSCPTCSGHKKYEVEDMKSIVEEANYIFNYYDECQKKMNIHCGNNEHPPYDVNIRVFVRGVRCPHCQNVGRLSISEVRESLEREGYSLLSEEYINLRTPIHIRCNMGHEYTSPYSNFKNGYRCPKCNGSSGEKRITSYLESLGEVYEREKTFEDCVWETGYKLRYDFYIETYRLLIEFDGRQHFQDCDFFGSDFELIKAKDEYKDKYAKEKNFNLLRIPYWEFDNIEDIIKNTIANLKVKPSTTIS